MSSQISSAEGAAVRIKWIDIAKGIGILCVIVGHCLSKYYWGNVLRGVIFSFHMSLFFILSGATYRFSSSAEELVAKIRKLAKRLLLPAVVLFLINTVVSCIVTPSQITDGLFWRGRLFSLIFSSGISTRFSSVDVPAAGMIWFFFALFFSSVIFDYLNLTFRKKVLLPAVCVLCVLGIILSATVAVPFSLAPSLAALPFLYFGTKLKDLRIPARAGRVLLISLPVWIVTLYITFPDYEKWTYLEFASGHYGLFPINYICAAAGTVFVCSVSVFISRLGKPAFPLLYLGKNTLYMFFIHILDKNWSFLWYIEDHQFISALLRLVCDIVLFVIFMLLKHLLRRSVPSKRSS